MRAAWLCLVSFAFLGCGPEKPKDASTPAPKQGGSGLTKLVIEDTKPGTGTAAAPGDMLWVKYTGKLKNGKVFDTNIGPDKMLLNFSLGAGAMIKGWDQGLVGMKEGGKRVLKVPSELGYGSNDRGVIPPNSDLYFDIELVKVLKKEDTQAVSVAVLKKGTGRACKAGDTITIDYIGKTLEGDLIDSTKKQGQPATFKLGAGALMVAGLEDGILGPPPMKIGETRKIDLPPNYGMPVGLGNVKGVTIQTFTVTLLKIQ